MFEPHLEDGTILKPHDQLYWFVNKLLSLSKKQVTELFPLGRYAWGTEFESENQEYASYCIEMLEKMRRDATKYPQLIDGKDLDWHKNMGWDGYDYAILIDCCHIPF